MESGYQGAGGRYDYSQLLTEENWKSQVDEALRQALVNLDSVVSLDLLVHVANLV
jgi:TldD protein